MYLRNLLEVYFSKHPQPKTWSNMAAVQFGLQRQEGKGLVNGFTISMHWLQDLLWKLDNVSYEHASRNIHTWGNRTEIEVAWVQFQVGLHFLLLPCKNVQSHSTGWWHQIQKVNKKIKCASIFEKQPFQIPRWFSFSRVCVWTINRIQIQREI